MRLILRLLALWLALAALPAAAQTPVEARAQDVVRLLREAKADPAAFTPQFLAAVPPAQLEAVAAQLRAANGEVTGLGELKPEGTSGASFAIDYAQATITGQFALEPAAPFRFIGLRITGVTRKGDSLDKVVAELKTLPGRTALRIEKLGAPALLADHNGTQPFATGSIFKLFVLDALAGEVAAKRRRWGDVVPLGRPSLTSGVTQDWPRGSPVTLHSLAVQMISISDNTATDTLIEAIGRPRVDAARARFGTTPGALPVLTTLDAFALKTDAAGALRDRWTTGGLADRRQVLNELEPSVETIDRRTFGGNPRFIDTVEWPATMAEVSAVLADLRTSPEALGILGVNGQLAPDVRKRFAAIGYKGGSEPGVIAMSWLLKTAAGDWYTVAGAWNDAAAPVDEARFVTLMQRAVGLVGK